MIKLSLHTTKSVQHTSSPRRWSISSRDEIIYSSSSSGSKESPIASATSAPVSSEVPSPVSHESHEVFAVYIHRSLFVSLISSSSTKTGNLKGDLQFDTEFDHHRITVEGLSALAEYAYRGIYTTKSPHDDIKVWALADHFELGGLRALARIRIGCLQDADLGDVRHVLEYAFLTLKRDRTNYNQAEVLDWLAGLAAVKLDDIQRIMRRWVDHMITRNSFFGVLLVRHMLPAKECPKAVKPNPNPVRVYSLPSL